MNPILLFAAMLGAPHQGPKKPTHTADEMAIKSTHSRLMAAFKANSADAIKSLFTKDFTETAKGITFNRDEAAAQMAQGMASSKVEWTMGGLDISGNKASYTSNFKYETTIVDTAGSFGPKGKTHKMSGAGIQKVQLIKDGGKWLYNHMEVGSVHAMMDGKPFNTQGTPDPAKKPAQ